jgi:hypothetical protein
MSRSIVMLSILLLACADSTKPAEPNDSGTSGGDGASEMVCEPGADQSCNDNPAISSLHGRCLPNGTCECQGGIEKNPETGRCL